MDENEKQNFQAGANDREDGSAVSAFENTKGNPEKKTAVDTEPEPEDINKKTTSGETESEPEDGNKEMPVKTEPEPEDGNEEMPGGTESEPEDGNKEMPGETESGSEDDDQKETRETTAISAGGLPGITDDESEQEPAEGKEEGEKEEPVNVKKEIFSWVKMIVAVLVIVIVLTHFVIINARVPSSSMERTIMTKDRLIGFRFSYWFGDPERGDIVLFKYPVNEDQTFIKRVIGLPGETVRITDGKIYIDDATQPLDENYLPEEWVWENDGYTFHVPEDSYLVLGDNRNYSDDARFWAENAIEAGKASTPEEAQKYTYVKKSAIKGKAIFIYYKGFKLLTHTADYQD